MKLIETPSRCFSLWQERGDMMQIQYENAQGEATDINRGDIRIVSVTGLSPVSVINTSSISGYREHYAGV